MEKLIEKNIQIIKIGERLQSCILIRILECNSLQINYLLGKAAARVENWFQWSTVYSKNSKVFVAFLECSICSKFLAFAVRYNEIFAILIATRQMCNGTWADTLCILGEKIQWIVYQEI